MLPTVFVELDQNWRGGRDGVFSPVWVNVAAITHMARETVKLDDDTTAERTQVHLTGDPMFLPVRQTPVEILNMARAAMGQTPVYIR